MAEPDAVTLEERIFQIEKVFFTGLELLLGTDPENLDNKRVDDLFDAYERVVSKSYDSDEDFKKAVQDRNKELEKFRDYVIKELVLKKSGQVSVRIKTEESSYFLLLSSLISFGSR